MTKRKTARPMLLLNTVRHLRPVQILSRVYFHVLDELGDADRWSRRRHNFKLGECHWQPRGPFLPPLQLENSAETIREGRFCFQHDKRLVGIPTEWNPIEAPLLWQYNLHYFDYLWSLDYDSSRTLVEDWMDRHPIGSGQIGWAPYPTSLRLLNWCAFFFGRHLKKVRSDAPFQNRLQKSISLQTAWLSRRLEYHLLGNHLLENAAALVLVGACFNGPDSHRWFEAGLRILRRELREQILADGMHFELSPMYHLRVLYVLLWLMNAVPDEVHDWLGQYALKMLDALGCTTHPDGDIALLNDSALGVYPPPFDLAEYAGRLGVTGTALISGRSETFALPYAGYYGARTTQGHFVICDAGRIGPDYIPGHAHGDIFSFELSLFGDRIIVDSGVHDYVRGEIRDYCRSTAAHNTVEISGQDQCEFWDAFKVARRGRPRDVQFEETELGFRLTGGHDGYRHLAGQPIHRRLFEWSHDGTLTIQDSVESNATVPFVSRLHLHPACEISELDESSLIVARGRHRLVVRSKGGRLQIGKSWYFPAFGLRQENYVIELIASSASIALSLVSCAESDIDSHFDCRENAAGCGTEKFRSQASCLLRQTAK